MSKLIGLDATRPGGAEAQAPRLISAANWQDYITARVNWYVTQKFQKAALIHVSIQQGSPSQEVVNSVPFACVPAIMTVFNLFRMDPRDLPTLYMQVATGCFAVEPMAYDLNALHAAIDKNAEACIGHWTAAINEASPETVAVHRKGGTA